MGISKNSATPKWMVKIMENPIRMDDLGGKNPPTFGNTQIMIPLLVVRPWGPKSQNQGQNGSALFSGKCEMSFVSKGPFLVDSSRQILAFNNQKQPEMD